MKHFIVKEDLIEDLIKKGFYPALVRRSIERAKEFPMTDENSDKKLSNNNNGGKQ